MSLIQHNSGAGSYITSSPTELDVAFTSANGAGRTLLAAVHYYNADFSGQFAGDYGTVSDTNGNVWSKLPYQPTYSLAFQTGYLQLWLAKNCNAGVNTVKFIDTTGSNLVGANVIMAIAEYSELGSNPVVTTGGEADFNYFGVSPPASYALTVTDSNGDSATITVNGNPSGTQASMALNLFGGGKNQLFLVISNAEAPSSVPITPSGYGTLTMREHQVPPSYSGKGIQFYDSLPLTTTRAQLEQMVLPNA